MEIQTHLSPWSSPSRCHSRSQWLHTTLSDLDMKMKTMIKIIGKNAECGAELTQMLEELDRSYRVLAEEHDQLRSKSTHFPSSSKLTVLKTRTENFHHDPDLEHVDSHPESVVEDPDSEFDSTNNLDHEYLDKIADELKSSELSNNIDSPNTDVGDVQVDGCERGSNWCELKFQVMKLMEENIRQQAELLRRNAEKRETIKELRSRLEHLKAENRDLRSCLGCLRVDGKEKHNHKSRLKGQFPLKFLGCS